MKNEEKSDLKNKEAMGKRVLQDQYVHFDWAIKRMLRQKANLVVLEGFLTVILGEEIRIVEILESEGYREQVEFNHVAIKALNSKDEIIIVEIQNMHEMYYLEHTLYSKAITEHISIGESYELVKKVYSISILYFDIGIGTDYIYHGQNQFIGVHTGDHLHISRRERDVLVPHLPSEIFPEYILIRVNEFDQVARTPLNEWIKYLKDGTIQPDTTVPGLREAREKLAYYSMPPAERQIYERHLDDLVIQQETIDNARQEGHIEGKAEGKVEGIRQVAANLKRMGLDIDSIAKSTGLSQEEIISL